MLFKFQISIDKDFFFLYLSKANTDLDCCSSTDKSVVIGLTHRY